jgi:hypothetical protein
VPFPHFLVLGYNTITNRNVYVADTGNHCVRRVSPSGIVATVAGICGAKMDGYHDG